MERPPSAKGTHAQCMHPPSARTHQVHARPEGVSAEGRPPLAHSQSVARSRSARIALSRGVRRRGGAVQWATEPGEMRA